MNVALFLDRDGTINPDLDYLSDANLFELYDGVGEALKKIKDAGYLLVLITNQSGIARGLITLEQLDQIHKKMQNLLLDYQVQFDAIYYCPHHPNFPLADGVSSCNCRKPAPGMLLKAAKELNIDLANSYMIGDKTSDVGAGINAGAQPIFLGNKGICDCDTFSTLVDAIEFILNKKG